MATRAEAAAYVDTSALIAFVDRSDTYHTLFQRLFAAPPKLITTALVVAEGHAWFLRRYDSFRALRFLAMIEDMTPLVVKSVGVDEQRGGTKMLRKFSDQEITLTDAIGLYLMAEHKIKRCWSTDQHLRLTGIPLAIDNH